MPRRLGSAEEAGRLCVTPARPDGVSGRTYRPYVARLGAPAAVRYNPSTGVAEHDLDAVEEWNRSRPGRGRHVIAPGASPKRTKARHAVLTGAAGDALVVAPVSPDNQRRRRSALRLEGRELTLAEAAAVTELTRAGLLKETARPTRLRLTAAGKRLLVVWERQAAEQP